MTLYDTGNDESFLLYVIDSVVQDTNKRYINYFKIKKKIYDRQDHYSPGDDSYAYVDERADKNEYFADEHDLIIGVFTKAKILASEIKP
jgi:hypothetical protein